jgi:hypothetical protein
MQTEKYLYWLNKSGKEGEKRLNTKYKNELPAEIKITNPSAIIIMGRSSNLSDNQSGLSGCQTLKELMHQICTMMNITG